VETYNHQGKIENEGVWFPGKATDTVIVVDKKQGIPVRLEWRRRAS
jgi:hypothetical protein